MIFHNEIFIFFSFLKLAGMKKKNLAGKSRFDISQN